MSNSELELRCNALRHDLKAWEKSFVASHEGRKAGREDIKADAAISQKYKEYNKLRDALSGKVAPRTPSKRAASHKGSHDIVRTPKAPQAPASTPRKRKHGDEGDIVYSVASPAQLLSPQGPTMVGPTPQRDGIVLGLFDLIPAETPSKTRAVLNEVVPNILRTPSKKMGKAQSETSLESRERRDKTPLSAGRRFLLDQFVTPKKRKFDEEGTPTSASKGFATPAFLRRDNFLPAIDEENEPTPRPAPWKRRGLGRSLSTIIQSLRKQEEDRLDEEADIMRELELEAEGLSVPKKPKPFEDLVKDSQGSMPLGPDRGLESDGEGEEIGAGNELGPDGNPIRIWKKKGLKRQTRRVIMRPNFSKPKPPPAQAWSQGSEEEDNARDTETIPGERPSNDELSEDDDISDYASDHSHTPKKRKVQKKKGKPDPIPKVAPSADGPTGQEGPVKAAARKIKATAHANYRRLKIKSKGGNGGKGRFGRRR